MPKKELLRYAMLEDAHVVAAAWDADPASIKHIGDSGNSVFFFRTRGDVPQILRLTDDLFRSEYEVQAELAFLAHLKKNAVPVAAGVPNAAGEWTVRYESARGKFIVSVLEYAEGFVVTRDSPYYAPAFFRAWGRNIALIHRASQTYDPPPSVPRVWQWDEENLLRRAPDLIPPDDGVTQGILVEVMERCRAMERTPETFGVTHADHGPQNFHYSPEKDLITAFDFGNACYHWFLSDVAIALSTFRTRPDREEIRRELLAGYTEIRPLPADADATLALLNRLRTLYVYLARLYAYGDAPDATQQQTLAELRARIQAEALA